MQLFKYYVLLVASCFMWGATPVCGKLLVNSMSPLTLTGTRFFLVGVILFAWLLIVGKGKEIIPDKRSFLILCLLGITGITMHNGIMMSALHYTTATNVALIESIGPTITTVLAFIFLGERLSHMGWVGILIACVGAVCIVAKGSLSLLLSLEFNIGDLLVFVSEAMWSIYVTISLFLKAKINPLATTGWVSIIGGLLSLIIAYGSGNIYIENINGTTIFAFFYLVLFAGILAFVAWNEASLRIGASKSGAFVYLVPLAGAVIGVLFLGEEILISQIVGGLLIVGGMVVTMHAKLLLKSKKVVPV